MDLTKFDKHLGKKAILELKNEDGGIDEFEFKQISYEQFGEFMVLAGKNMSSGDPKTIMQNIAKDPESLKNMQNIFLKIVEDNYPELPKDKAKEFVVTNFTAIGKFIKEIMPKKQEESEEKMTLIKQKLKQIQDAKRQNISKDKQ